MSREADAEAHLIEVSRWQREEAARLGICLAALDHDKPAPCPLIEAKGLTTKESTK